MWVLVNRDGAMIVDTTRLIIVIVIAGSILVVLADFGAWAWLREQFRVPRDVEWKHGEASADSIDDAPSSDQVYYAVAERRLDAQVATNDLFDSKTSAAVGLGSTVLPLTFGLLSLSGRSLPGVTQWLLVMAVVAYVLLIAVSARTSHIRAIAYRPDLRTLRRHSDAIDGAALRRWVAEEYALSAEINDRVLEYKARWVGRVNLVLYAEGILIAAAAAVALVRSPY
jgi:hypothetical protein